MKLGRSRPLLRRTPLRSRPKRHETKTCAECGAEFAPWRATQRYCSKMCSGKATARSRVYSVDTTSPRDRHGKIAVEKTCAICSAVFLVPRGRAGIGRKTCSHACATLLKRTQGGSDRMGAANPNFKSGKRVGIRERAGEERWRLALGDRCMAPGCRTPTGERLPLFLHHICYRQHVRKEGGDIWDPRNGFTICNSCHARHHRRGKVLPVSCLPDAALEFAVALFGEYAVDYLRRYYHDDDDPRLAILVGFELPLAHCVLVACSQCGADLGVGGGCDNCALVRQFPERAA